MLINLTFSLQVKLYKLNYLLKSRSEACKLASYFQFVFMEEHAVHESYGIKLITVNCFNVTDHYEESRKVGYSKNHWSTAVAILKCV